MCLVPKWGSVRGLMTSFALSLVGVGLYLFLRRFWVVRIDWVFCGVIFVLFGLLADVLYLRRDITKLQAEVQSLKK